MQKALLGITLILLVFGLVMLSSAGVVDGQKKFGSPYWYVWRQMLNGVLPGLALMWSLSRIDYRFWKKMALPILFGALALMVLVFIPQFGVGAKGATRWINVYGVSLQPAEVLKLSLIIYLAAWFGSRDSRMKDWAYGTAPFFIVLSFVALLLLMQPDLGTLIITVGIALTMYFLAGVELKKFLVVVAILVLGGVAAIASSEYRRDRVITFLNPDHDPRGISYQLNQSLIAIGSGGMFGVGFGKSTQKFGFLPEVTNDSIFAVIVEELGFVGGVVTIGLFVTFFGIICMIARELSDPFGRLLILGIGIWITGQAFLNMAAISGLAPLTGIPLPFISYGGTALMAILASLGIALNVAKHARRY